MPFQYIYNKYVENRPDDIIWGDLMQVGLSSLPTDLIVKTFLDFSSLYCNPILEAGIFAAADYYYELEEEEKEEKNHIRRYKKI